MGTSPTSMHTVYMETEKARSYNSPVPNKQGNNKDGDIYYSPNYHHIITVTGLEPSTTYYYRPIVNFELRTF